MVDIVKTQNPYTQVVNAFNKLEVSSKDILFETVDARAVSSQNITWDIQSKGSESLLCSDAYITAYFKFKVADTANGANPIALNADDKVCLRNGFQDKIILNSTFNWNGTNINERPYLACRELDLIGCSNDWQRKYGGVGGGYTDLDAIRTIDDDDKADTERRAKIAFFRQLVGAGAGENEVAITFPLKLSPFRANRDSMWWKGMSYALPYVDNASLNFQIKQEIAGIALQVFTKHNNAKSFFFRVSDDKSWKLHLRWYNSPTPLSGSYTIPHCRMEHYFKSLELTDLQKTVAATIITDVNRDINTDLARVGQKPEWLLFYVAEDVLNSKSYGNDAAFRTFNAAQGYLKAANIQIKGLDLQISNQQGVISAQMNEDVLMNYTKQYIKEFPLGYNTFKNYRNFVLLKTSDLANGNDAFAGVQSNCNIKANVKLGKYPYTTADFDNDYDAEADDKRPANYNLHMVFIYTSEQLTVSPGSVEVRSQALDPSVVDSSVRSSMGGSITGGAMSYTSRF
jgi:hypothetical protein